MTQCLRWRTRRASDVVSRSLLSQRSRRGATGGSKRARNHISHEVRREVALRDELQCTFVSPDGTRCTARHFLQFHHELAWARGGGDGVEDLRLLCTGHNRLLAERDFGAAHVAKRIAERSTLPGQGAGPKE